MTVPNNRWSRSLLLVCLYNILQCNALYTSIGYVFIYSPIILLLCTLCSCHGRKSCK